METPCGGAGQLPEPGTSIELLPGIHWIRLPLPFGIDHINVWLLADGDGWTLVDTGLSSNTGREIWNRVLPPLLDNKPLKRVLVTHFHPDHLGLAGWFCQEWGAELWMADQELRVARELISREGGAGDRNSRDAFLADHGLDQQGIASLYQSADDYPSGIWALPRHHQGVADGTQLMIGDSSWAVRLGEGHALAQISLANAQRQLLISGDDLLPDITTNISLWHHKPDADPMGAYLTALHYYRRQCDDFQVLPSHGAPYRGAGQRAQQLRAHYLERAGKIWEMCEKPTDAASLTRRLFRRPLKGFHVLLALGETLASLNFLWHRGFVLRERDGAGRYWFRKSGHDWYSMIKSWRLTPSFEGGVKRHRPPE